MRLPRDNRDVAQNLEAVLEAILADGTWTVHLASKRQTAQAGRNGFNRISGWSIRICLSVIHPLRQGRNP